MDLEDDVGLLGSFAVEQCLKWVCLAACVRTRRLRSERRFGLELESALDFDRFLFGCLMAGTMQV
jgi:hypothetical protein